VVVARALAPVEVAVLAVVLEAEAGEKAAWRAPVLLVAEAVVEAVAEAVEAGSGADDVSRCASADEEAEDAVGAKEDAAGAEEEDVGEGADAGAKEEEEEEENGAFKTDVDDTREEGEADLLEAPASEEDANAGPEEGALDGAGAELVWLLVCESPVVVLRP
jgi:hypothetical protein